MRQVVHPVDRARKRELLSHLVRTHAIDQALVFTRTKHGADRLAKQLLEDGIATAAIHGNKSQPQRMRALTDFKAGRVTLLIATEVAARGLDIEQLPHVVNYELPMVPSDYLHRIGRTGRAGHRGRRHLPRLHRRGTDAARDRATPRSAHPDRGRARLRDRSVHPSGADPPAQRWWRPAAASHAARAARCPPHRRTAGGHVPAGARRVARMGRAPVSAAVCGSASPASGRTARSSTTPMAADPG